MLGGSFLIHAATLAVLSLAVCEGRGVDLGLCADSQVTCQCGSPDVQLHVHIPIKQCTVWLYGWLPYCTPCRAFNVEDLCSQFRHCKTCHASPEGGCASCPPGRQGPDCQKAVCGRSDEPRVVHIIRGQMAKGAGEWPWQALIAHRQPNGDFRGVCSGTLISEHWVVTSGVCVTNRSTINIMPLGNLKIYLGKYHLGINNDDEFAQVFQVSEIHVHPNYDPVVLDSDIALVRLSREATLTDRVSPICLASSDSTGIKFVNELIRPGSNIIATGWDQTVDRRDSNALMQFPLGTISAISCEDKYAASGLPLIVTRRMFCAGHDDVRSDDTCLGDSGGPAVSFSEADRRWYLVGVSSWGSPLGCGVGAQYSGFTKISTFLSFISKFTGV